MKKPREVIQRWGVYRLGGKKAQRMPFTVQAGTSEEALKRAINEYDVPQHEQFRISVQREG